jgi:hypothetical protein
MRQRARTANAAYLAAQPGDTVRLADNQTITVGSILPDASKAGNATDVVFQSGVNTLVDACPSGSCGTVYPFTIDAHDITFNNFKFANQTSNLRDDYEEPATGAGSSNITFVNLDSSSIQMFGANTTVTGGDIGPCFTNKANPVCQPRAFGSSGATFDGVTFHDQMSDQTSGGPCASPSNPTDTCHTDGLGVFAGATNTTVKNSRFYNNDNTNIRVQSVGGVNSGVTFQNNFFGVAWQTSALPSSDDTTTTTVTNPWMFGVDIDTATAGLVISPQLVLLPPVMSDRDRMRERAHDRGDRGNVRVPGGHSRQHHDRAGRCLQPRKRRVDVQRYSGVLGRERADRTDRQLQLDERVPGVQHDLAVRDGTPVLERWHRPW